MGYDSERIKLVLNRAHSRVGISQSDVVARSRPRTGHLHSERPRDPARRQRGRADRARPSGVRRVAGVPQACRSLPRHRVASHCRDHLGREAHAQSSRASRKEGLDGAPRATDNDPPGHAHPAGSAETEPFADLKNQIHMTVIGELGPQLSSSGDRPGGDCASASLPTIRHHLQAEAGISREDRERIASELADDILGHGPLERLLADESDHGDHGQRTVRHLGRAPGTPLRDDGALQRRVAPAPDHQQDRRAGRASHRRVLADGRRSPARRQPRQRDHPAAVAHRAR